THGSTANGHSVAWTRRSPTSSALSGGASPRLPPPRSPHETRFEAPSPRAGNRTARARPRTSRRAARRPRHGARALALGAGDGARSRGLGRVLLRAGVDGVRQRRRYAVSLPDAPAGGARSPRRLPHLRHDPGEVRGTGRHSAGGERVTEAETRRASRAPPRS